MTDIDIRKEMPPREIDKAEFAKRYREKFNDPAFAPLQSEIEKIIDAAWDGYDNSRKSPYTHPAGPGYADPDYALSDTWREASERIKAASARQRDPSTPSSILLINGAARTEHTCPSETSKTYRLAMLARKIFDANAIETEFLDLSRIISERGRTIHPCKTCVSTAMPLCHWPCSCYPNHSLGQLEDWMNDIYPMWSAAHGIMILTPVNWYSPSSVLKLMIDRLVCADGGNTDPSSTQGKDAERAKKIELAGWPFPKHLGGRVFSVIAHGDAAGAENVKTGLSSWLTDMGLIEAGAKSQLATYIGYQEPYATSHAALDGDDGLQEEVRNAARSLVQAVTQLRDGRLQQPDAALTEPRPK